MQIESKSCGRKLVQGSSVVLRLPQHGNAFAGMQSRYAAVSVSLRIDGIPWEQVEALESTRSNDPIFVVSIEEDGTATVKFGNGENGRRLPSGVRCISAHYTTGGGSAGDVPEGKAKNSEACLVYLDVWTREVTAIEDVRLAESALDGADTSNREP